MKNYVKVRESKCDGIYWCFCQKQNTFNSQIVKQNSIMKTSQYDFHDEVWQITLTRDILSRNV